MTEHKPALSKVRRYGPYSGIIFRVSCQVCGAGTAHFPREGAAWASWENLVKYLEDCVPEGEQHIPEGGGSFRSRIRKKEG